MAKPESVVVYEGLPLSAGSTHGLGKITSPNAFSAWTRFLDKCTVPAPTTHYFSFPQTPNLSVEPRVREHIEAVFPLDVRNHRCPVPPDRVHEAIDLLVSLEPQPRNPWGMSPVWLWSTSEFRLLRPEGGEWPGQDPDDYDFQTPGGVQLGASRSALILEGKRSMSVSLSFPGATDAEVTRTAAWLQEHLPFRLSSKHWTRWTLAQNGRTYRGRKIVV